MKIVRNHKISREKGIELFTNESSRFMNLDSVTIHYRDEGKGFPVVLIHGLGASLHKWDKLTERLAKHCRVLRLDLPGFGLSGYKEKQDKDFLVDCVYKWLHTLGVGNFYLVGSSLGGWISWEFAGKHPEMVKKLVLISPAGFFDGNIKSPVYQITSRPVFKKLLKNGVPRLLVKLVLRRQVYNKRKLSRDFVNTYYHLINIDGNFENLFLLAQNELLGKTERLKDICCPSLIIWGQNDPTIPVEHAYRFKELIPYSELEVYEKTGHIPMVEWPYRLFADILSFFNR